MEWCFRVWYLSLRYGHFLNTGAVLINTAFCFMSLCSMGQFCPFHHHFGAYIPELGIMSIAYLRFSIAIVKVETQPLHLYQHVLLADLCQCPIQVETHGTGGGLHTAPIILSPSPPTTMDPQLSDGIIGWTPTVADCARLGDKVTLGFPFWNLRSRALDSPVMGIRTQREDGDSHGGEMNLAWIFCGSYMYGISPWEIAYFNRICKRVNLSEDPFLFVHKECSQLRSIQFLQVFLLRYTVLGCILWVTLKTFSDHFSKSHHGLVADSVLSSRGLPLLCNAQGTQTYLFVTVPTLSPEKGPEKAFWLLLFWRHNLCFVPLGNTDDWF